MARYAGSGADELKAATKEAPAHTQRAHQGGQPPRPGTLQAEAAGRGERAAGRHTCSLVSSQGGSRQALTLSRHLQETEDKARAGVAHLLGLKQKGQLMQIALETRQAADSKAVRAMSLQHLARLWQVRPLSVLKD